MRSRPPFGRIAAATLETLAWVGLATALVPSSIRSPRRGLGSLYLIAVLAVAIRRGQVAALAAAALGVLTLNFFFIKPLHQLTIADSDNVVALAVLLLAALVVGRLAGQSRQRAAEAELRAAQAAAREHEAIMLADAATALLGGTDDLVAAISASLEAAGHSELRLDASAAPRAREGERVLRLPTGGTLRLAVCRVVGWSMPTSAGRLKQPRCSMLPLSASCAARAWRRAEASGASGCRQDRDPARGLTRPAPLLTSILAAPGCASREPPPMIGSH